MKTALPYAVFALVCAGCHPADDETLEAPVPTRVAFEGSPDARLAGDWTTADRKLFYTLRKDGGYSTGLVSAIKGQADATTRAEGEWRVNGDRALFKDAAGSVVPYVFDLKGDVLTLTSRWVDEGQDRAEAEVGSAPFLAETHVKALAFLTEFSHRGTKTQRGQLALCASLSP